jgi:PAS domain S-box-containing protein
VIETLSNQQPTPAAATSPDARILLVEDSPDDTYLVTRELEGSGLNFNLTCVATRDAFAAALAQSAPDLVLTDYRMPGFCGLDVLHLSRQTYPDVPVIFISGVLGEELAIECLKTGATDYVVKQRLNRIGPIARRAIMEARERRKTRATEEALRESQERSRILFESALFAMAILNPQGGFVETNQAYQRLLGYSAPELGRMSMRNLLHLEDAKEVLALHRELQHGLRSHYEREVRLISKGGRIVWVRSLVSMLRRPGSEPLIVAMVEDITDRKNEERRRAAFSELNDTLSNVSTLRQTAEIICETAGLLFPWDACSLNLYDEERDELLPPIMGIDTMGGRRVEVTSREHVRTPSALTREVLAKGSKLVLRDRPEFSPDMIAWGDTTRPSASLMFVAVRARGHIVGLFTFQSYTLHAYTEEDLSVLHELADHCGRAVERVRALEALQQSESRFRTLCESSPIGIFESDARGCWTYMNARLRATSGLAVDRLEPAHWLRMVHPDDLPHVQKQWFEAVAEGRTWWSEHRILTPENCSRWVRTFATPLILDTSGCAAYIGIVEDITDRKRAASVQQELAAIVETSHDGIIGLNSEGIILSWNDAAERIYNYAAHAIKGKPFKDLIPPGRSDDSPLRRVQNGEALEDWETVHLRQDGVPIHVSVTISPLKDEPGNATCFSMIVRDITERKRMENEILNAVTAEQRRIGHDLHDGLCQYLTGIAFKTKILEEVLAGQSNPQTKDARQIVDLLNNAVQQARLLAHGLDPIEVVSKNLPDALQTLAEQSEQLYHIDCSLQSDPALMNLSPAFSLHFYRIAQESINNAVRHGKAGRIRLQLLSEGADLLLTVKDDGTGFVLNRKDSGMGLRTMEYRARSMGAVLKIDSTAGEGTLVRCLLPKWLAAG